MNSLSTTVAALAVLLHVAPPHAAAAPNLRETVPSCDLLALPGVGAQVARLERTLRSLAQHDTLGDRTFEAALLDDLHRVTRAIAASPAVAWEVASTEGHPPQVRSATGSANRECSGAIRERDTVAWTMTLGGYSAKEIADVLEGRLTRADLDAAQWLLMAGRSREAVAAFLEARWREPDAAGPAHEDDPSSFSREVSAFEAHILRMAAEHRLDARLVRAVIEAESGGDPHAVSRAGAIGLMQLMPGTARLLGVNPWDPLENIRGGVAYLAGMLRAYRGNVGLALVAYNAGPQHADRVRDGRALPYSETRRYLDAIRVRYPF